MFEYRRGRLFCEEVPLEKIAQEAGTPVYVYSATTILDHYRRLHAALGELDHLICYAVKANSNLAVLNLIANEGSGFDIVSAGELYRVIKAGGNPALCTFAGVGKSESEIHYALQQEILSFNVESESELRYINSVAQAMNRRAPIALRVNPDVAGGGHRHISTGTSENKFGIGIERVADVYEAAAAMPHIRIRGVQMHIGSQITSAAPFAAAIEKMLPLVASLQEKFGLEFFSIGGGIGIVYDSSLSSGQPSWWTQEPAGEGETPAARRLTIERYAETVVPLLKKLGIKILFEPGRFMVGNAGVLLTKIQYIKQSTAKTFVIVDAGMNDLIRPVLYEGYHEVVPLQEPKPESKQTVVDVVGPVCESGDFLAQNRALPPVNEGDFLALMSAGAYGFSMASNYNSRPMPAEVLVSGRETHLIRERQTLADLVRGEQIPQRQESAA